MNWHVITRIGAADGFEPAIPASDPRILAAMERPDDPWLVGNNVLSRIEDKVGTAPQTVAIDLLYLAMAVYAADLRIPRRLTLDRWSRDITVHFPVQDIRLWSTQVPHVENMLGFLTGDRWSLVLRAREATASEAKAPTLDYIQCVCLFSGGLDSLVGAADLLANGQSVALVGHHGAGTTNSVQDRVLSAVSGKYGTAAVPFMFYVQPPKQNIKDGEPSMRSRSFLFFSMGAAVSSALGGKPLIVAENGLISLNVPLTSSRNGSLSTRTTHPHYMSMFMDLLRGLGLPNDLDLPYRFRTKGEMLKNTRDPRLLAEAARLTMSCSHPEAGRFRGHSPNNHCGYCVPCIIRRAAMNAAGLVDSSYNVDVRTNEPHYTEEAGRDYRAFRMALERIRGMTLGRAMFKVLGPGPLSSEDVREYASMYLRGMEEVRALLE